MKMTVKLHAGHNIDVAFAGIRSDATNLVLRKSGIGVKDGVTVQLDARFRVEVILISLPVSQKINLPLDLIFSWQRSMAHVHHDSAVREGGPIVDFGFWKCRPGVRSFSQLQQSLNT